MMTLKFNLKYLNKLLVLIIQIKKVDCSRSISVAQRGVVKKGLIATNRIFSLDLFFMIV